MNVAATLDEIGKPAWIALMVLSFFVYWPLGLAILAYLIWSRRMSGCGYAREWRMNAERMSEAARRWCPPGFRPSGNWAFDEYRAETLRRLEEEQREFREFLARLRRARDKAEFDQFMADRRGRNGSTGGPSPEPQTL
jgi:Protein of unknown function (DUF2852)